MEQIRIRKYKWVKAMKNGKKKMLGILMVGAIAAIMFRFGMVAGATNTAPGSVGDPLITQSYLEKRLGELVKDSTPTSYRKVSVTKGKQLILSEGSEFVIYSGQASVDASKGMINLSSGELVENDGTLKLYSNYLAPANSSGVTATKSCIIYVKGNYSIKG